jgi:hypothetical protein
MLLIKTAAGTCVGINLKPKPFNYSLLVLFNYFVLGTTRAILLQFDIGVYAAEIRAVQSP